MKKIKYIIGIMAGCILVVGFIFSALAGDGHHHGQIGDCFLKVPVDVDENDSKEEICMMSRQYEKHDDIDTYSSLVIVI